MACAEINLAALRHNFSLVRHHAARSRIMCVIKANAYGHGMLQVAETLSEADGFAVACVDEAITLRQNGIEKPITIFQGFADEAELAACSEYSLWPLLHCDAQLKLLQVTKKRRPAGIWLKLSSGMNRLGFACEQAQLLWQGLIKLEGIQSVGLMTHMACADEGSAKNPVTDFTLKQIDRFMQNTQQLAGEKSLANSATLLSWPQAQADWVRPGIMLYGASPFLPGITHNCVNELKPVMRLTSRLIAINQLRKGNPIGYGCSWHCPEDMPVGVVAIGYGDGYPRHIDAHASVSINNQCAAVVGRVSMDLLTIDLRNIAAAVGDQVVLWGPELPVDDIARSAETIAYELTCGIYGRVQYRYID
ncbi:MAG: alanine racemase [Gammaproteobacteria bacterium]|nr:alanine racemase [Gammaproteobacteria bacterium]